MFGVADAEAAPKVGRTGPKKAKGEVTKKTRAEKGKHICYFWVGFRLGRERPWISDGGVSSEASFNTCQYT